MTLSLTINEKLKPALIAAHLNAGHSGGDSVAIGIYSPSSPTSIPLPPFSPSLISLMVSVDVCLLSARVPLSTTDMVLNVHRNHNAF